MKKSTSGFTIVELLIVIVVIGILAAIVIVAYNGVQARARDSKRVTDMAAIQKALALYKIDNGVYPASAPNPGNSTFEVSSDPNFLATLYPYSNNTQFRDPVNSSTSNYRYHTFPAGSYGCDPALGAYYTLFFVGMESQTSPLIEPGACTTQALFIPGQWNPTNKYFVTYGF